MTAGRVLGDALRNGAIARPLGAWATVTPEQIIHRKRILLLLSVH
jgi:hypothetical protein